MITTTTEINVNTSIVGLMEEIVAAQAKLDIEMAFRGGAQSS